MKSFLLAFTFILSAQSFATDISYDCSVPKGNGYSTDTGFDMSYTTTPYPHITINLDFDSEYDLLMQSTDVENVYLGYGGYSKVALMIPDISMIEDGEKVIEGLTYSYYDGAERPASCVRR